MPKKILRRSRNPRNDLRLRTLQSDEPAKRTPRDERTSVVLQPRAADDSLVGFEGPSF